MAAPAKAGPASRSIRRSRRSRTSPRLFGSYDAATFELSLASRDGEKYSVPVVATATEPGGGNATTATASFSPLGYFTGFKPGDLGKLDLCMGK